MGERVYSLRDSDCADLARRIELNYRKRAETYNQPWATSFRSDDPRGTSIYDQFRQTWFDLCRWATENGVDLVKALNNA